MAVTAEESLEVFDRVEHNAEMVGEHFECIEIIDIDRNLLRTERLSTIIEEACEARGVSRQHLRDIRGVVEESGGSFDTFTELRARYDSEFVDQIKQAVFEEARARHDLSYVDEKCLFYPGAREIIDKKPREGTIRTFVTRGGEESQRLKLDIFGVDLEDEYYAIVPLNSVKTKAEMTVESFDEASGKFLFKWLTKGKPDVNGDSKLVNIWADRVIVIDDKASELVALGRLDPSTAIGYWHRTGDEKKSQALVEGQTLPANIYEIQSLYEIGPLLSRVGRVALGHTPDWARMNRRLEAQKYAESQEHIDK